MATTEIKAPPASAETQRTLQALAWMMGALISFSLVAIAGREAGKSVTTIEIIFWRSIASVLILAGLIAFTKQGFGQLRTERLSLHTARSLVHMGAQYSWLYALMLIPLAELFALEFTAPLWVALLAPLLVGEALTRNRLIAALVGFVGTLIVVQPGSASISLGTLLALASALGFALSMIATKRLVRTETVLCILFYMVAIQLVISLALAAPLLRLPTLVEAKWLGIITVASLFAHYSLTQAFARADAMIVAPMDFFRLPLIAGVAALLYREPIEWTVLAGGLVIVAANLFNLWSERRRRPAG